VNRRTNTVSLQAVLQEFSGDQRAWYNAMLKEDLPRCGYALDSDELLEPANRPPSADGGPRSTLPKEFHGYELQMLKQALVERDCEIGRLCGEIKELRATVKELQGVLTAVQNSVLWRLLEMLRRVRRRVLPTGRVPISQRVEGPSSRPKL